MAGRATDMVKLTLNFETVIDLQIHFVKGELLPRDSARTVGSTIMHRQAQVTLSPDTSFSLIARQFYETE
jgi:hypothetical protein